MSRKGSVEVDTLELARTGTTSPTTAKDDNIKKDHKSAAGDDDENLTLIQAVKKYHRVSFYCVGLTSAILMYGYDYVIVGSTSSMPSFQKDFGLLYKGKWILPSLWLGLWNFASPGASMVGAVIGGFLQDWLGRRSSLGAGSFVSALSVAVLFVANRFDDIHTRRVVFLVGKAIQGTAIGVVMATTQTYMSEVLPPIIRGSILAFFSTFTLLGQLIGAAVIYACLGVDDGYVICFATQWLFSAIPLIMAFFVPESPTYLIRKGRYDAALRSQRRLDSPGMDSQLRVDDIRANIEHERLRSQSTYADCFRPANIRRTIIIVIANLLPNMFGLSLLAKASYYLQVVGMEPSLSLLLLIIGIVCGFVSNIVSIWMISWYRRRFLSLTSLAVLIPVWFSSGVAGIWSGQPTVWYTAVSLTLVIIIAGLGVWPCSYAISAETSSLELRAKSQGIGWLTAGGITSLFGFVLPYIFNTDQGNLGAKTGFVFAGLCTVGFILVYFFIPEMKGRSAAEIDELFEQKVKARHSSAWVPVREDAQPE